MTFETLAFGVAGFCVSMLMVLVGYTGDRMQKSIDQLREMLDERLADVTSKLTSIDKDLNVRISEVTQENASLDRRITQIETEFNRRMTNGKH